MDKWTLKSGQFGAKILFLAIIGPGRLIHLHFRVLFWPVYSSCIHNEIQGQMPQEKLVNMDKWTLKSGRFVTKSLYLAIIGPGRLVYHHFRLIFGQYTPHIYIMTYKDRYH